MASITGFKHAAFLSGTAPVMYQDGTTPGRVIGSSYNFVFARGAFLRIGNPSVGNTLTATDEDADGNTYKISITRTANTNITLTFEINNLSTFMSSSGTAYANSGGFVMFFICCGSRYWACIADMDANAYRNSWGHARFYNGVTLSPNVEGNISFPAGTTIEDYTATAGAYETCITWNCFDSGMVSTGTGTSSFSATTAAVEMTAEQVAIFSRIIQDNPIGPEPPSDDPYAGIDGESDLTGDTIAIPGDPGLSVTSTGIVGLFSPTSQQMQDLADFMWTDFGGTGTTVEDILGEIVQALKRSISNPLDYVIGLNIIPSQGLSKGSSKVIRFGFMSSGVSMPELNSQFFTVDCGSLSFDYLCGNTFLDYAPYSKFSIYLPYIGVKEVDANDFVGHTIGVKYKGDVVTGGLTAFITKDGSVMYQYSGSCALNIPLTADNWGSTISAAINVATAVIGAASMPGAGLASSAGAAGKAAVGATVSNVAANPSLLSPQVARSGAISGGAGTIGVQHPYVIREAVRFHSTEYFNTLTGYPAYYFRSLADMTGYTVVYDCHLENIPATDGEIREIEQLLEGGVIL